MAPSQRSGVWLPRMCLGHRQVPELIPLYVLLLPTHMGHRKGVFGWINSTKNFPLGARQPVVFSDIQKGTRTQIPGCFGGLVLSEHRVSSAHMKVWET